MLQRKLAVGEIVQVDSTMYFNMPMHHQNTVEKTDEREDSKNDQYASQGILKSDKKRRSNKAEILGVGQ